MKDLRYSISYYNAVSSNLGAKFFTRYTAAIDDLCFMPRTGRVIEADIRKLKIRGFPYALLYRVHEEHLEILRIANLRQDSEIWLK